MTGPVVPPGAQTAPPAGQPQGQQPGNNGGPAGGAAGGDGGAGGAGAQPQAGQGQQQGQGQQGDRGYPENTPVAEMTDGQQAAYWRHYARKHESNFATVTGGRPVADVQKDLAELEEIRKARQTPAEQQITAAREEGRRSALAESNGTVVGTLIRANLESRGWNETDIADHLASINASAFIADNQVDTARVLGHVNRIAGTATGGTTRGPDMGQGNRGQRTNGTGVAAGREMFEASRPKSKT